MARARSGWILRDQETPRRISYLELLFDLGLIVALLRLTDRLTGNLGWNHALETVVLLAAIWWVWTVTAYTTDWYDPKLPIVQLIVLGVLLGGLLMSLAVSSAFEGANGIAFAGAYVGLHLWRGLILITALRGHALQRRPMRVLIWFCLTGVLWLVGAFLPSPIRLVVAAGGDLVARDPVGEIDGTELAIVAAGPVVFLAGRAVYALVVFRAFLWRCPSAWPSWRWRRR
ncbi:low temperature requirement protein A [Micromonospora sp. AMSO31t]|uniref:low temperature requirement protein A n=1 Tax=Micromonospora sp. AMSO31t TaxID=2650566 RepID=UPI001788AB1D|nr:low temperature requirement protein A [Micromonospora sp. AMSO31t]